MRDIDDRHGSLQVVDAVDDAVGTTAGAVTVIKWWMQPLADAVRVVEYGANDELVRRKGHRLGEVFGELTPSGRGDDQPVTVWFAAHAGRWRR